MFQTVKELAEILEARIKNALRYQFKHGSVPPCDAMFMFEMMNKGFVGMDGFKFCKVEEAKSNRIIFLKQN